MRTSGNERRRPLTVRWIRLGSASMSDQTQAVVVWLSTASSPPYRRAGMRRPDRKSTRLNSSHTVIYTLSLHDALPILDTSRLGVDERPDPSRGRMAEYGLIAAI